MGNWVAPGVGDVGAYQVAGTPYVATTANNTKTLTLSFVTSEVVVVATAACTVHFGDAGNTTVNIPAATTATFKVRTKKIVITSGGVASVCAVLTGIPASSLDQHTQGDFGSTA